MGKAKRIVPAVNAGVHTATGIEFQKYCALYILLERYNEIKDEPYFIYLEHHEDVLFCYLNDEKLLSSIDAYQAKKSAVPWTMNRELLETLNGIAILGKSLLADNTIPKSPKYSHTLNFVTNNDIRLQCGADKKPKKLKIYESNDKVRYTELDPAIAKNLFSKIESITSPEVDHLDQINNLRLLFIDLPRTGQRQKETLIGIFDALFNNKVRDKSAAVESLLALFRSSENTLNQKNIARLDDESKRVEAAAINSAVNVITNRQQAYELWRARQTDISNRLSLSVLEKSRFESQFQNSLDLFKDEKQGAHQKVLRFVMDNAEQWAKHTDEISCVEAMYTSYLEQQTSTLDAVNLKAAIFAAFIKLKDKYDTC